MFWQDGRLEWYLTRGAGLAGAVVDLESAGASTIQDGDHEATGWVPLSALAAVLDAIKAARVPKGGSAEHLKAYHFTPQNAQIDALRDAMAPAGV